MTVSLVYFAWVRERIGKSNEEIDLPPDVITVGDLLNHLKTKQECRDLLNELLANLGMNTPPTSGNGTSNPSANRSIDPQRA